MGATPCFPKGFFRFLGELDAHNDREWFTKSKARYESEVLQPAVRFVEETGPRMASISRRIVSDPRPYGGSISRIYRDIRFSKDKTPYNPWVGIHFVHEMAKGSEEHLPGFALHLEPSDSWVASGIWHPSPASLGKIRDAIVRAPSEWGKLRTAGITLDGESYARVPAGFDAAHPLATDLKRKDFYSWLPIRDAQVTAATFPSDFVALCKKLDPLNRVLARAIDVPW